MSELEFQKYRQRGAYHWEQISSHPVKRNAFVVARYERCVSLLSDKVPSRASKVLDLGCGDGALAYLLSKRYDDVYGTDPSEIGVSLGREMMQQRNAKVTFSNHTGYDTGFETGYFDGVVCSDVIEHVQEPERLLQEIKRILKPGGTAVISTPIRFTERPLDAEHVIEWYCDEFLTFVRSVFPDAVHRRSHSIAWMEFMTRRRYSRMLTNIISLFWNPFLAEKGWRYYAIQFVTVQKPASEDEAS